MDYSLLPFFESSADLLCIAGFDGYFKKVNPALCKLLGFSENELLSKPINSFVHPDDQEGTQKRRIFIQSGKPLLNFENRYVSKSGQTVWLSWTSMPLNDKELVYAIAKNITHKKEQEKKRNQLITDLSEANERLKQLSYSTSHDLRSPVTNLLAVFSMLDTSTIKDPETLEFIGILEQATQNLKSMLDNYLDDLKVDEIKLEELDFLELIDAVQLSLDSLIRETHTRFQLDFKEFSTITFNRIYLESVFLNLITNSIKYAHPDRDPVITIKSVITEGTKQLIFSDNGQGFDSEKLKGKIFKLKQTFHNHKDGKGIGLYLVHSHITSLGGNITVDSEVNAGTTFTISFAF